MRRTCSRSRRPAPWCLCILLLAATAGSMRAERLERAELIRDQWGVPHVLARTDAGAMYGLGYATAEDRGFQMTYTLRMIQGRLAEILGDVKKVRRNETAAQSDRKMRTFGFYRAARRVAERLDPETKDLLQAYCDGVNTYFDRHRGDRHYLFDKLGVEPERWTPADCIAVWWRIAQFFGPDGTRDLVASRGRGRRLVVRGRTIDRSALAPRGDEAAAVVQREDVSDEWVEGVNRFLADHGLAPGADAPPGESGPKFSHAWVVGGGKTDTGAAILMSDPQTLVGNPSMFYEFHVQGDSFNARGIGVPGSPVILIGFTEKVAWGMTALGADQADLFRLKTDENHPDQYFFDGQWRRMEVTTETIKVRGGPDQTVRLRWTRFGPVVTDYVFARPEDGEFALKRIPICETDRDTAQGAFAMMRAGNAKEFGEALAGWRFPSANVVFGDASGDIGYWVLGALPIRSPFAAQGGRYPQNGEQSKYDWQGIVPHRWKPHVLNPRQGYLFSANHRPIGSFYKVYIGATTGAMGDTLRSFRLRELLSRKERFTAQDVLAIHEDSVNPARRDLAAMGYHLRDVLHRELSPDALRALEYLRPWYRDGCRSNLNVRGAELAGRINTMFRAGNTDLALRFGGGDTGLTLFLKSFHKRLADDPKAPLTAEEQEFVDRVLGNAWRSAMRSYGADPEKWPERAREEVAARRLGYYQSLDGFPSLDPAQDLPMPPLAVIDGATIHSQASQAYTQLVTLNDADRSQSVLPIGASERPGAAFRASTLSLWGEGKLHPAPLSRKAVEAIAASRTVLE